MSPPAIVSPPPGFRESYRGHVPAWHTDGVEHFTVAYYFERLERATARFLAEFGVSSLDVAVPRHRDFFVRFTRELRLSSVFVIHTGVMACDADRLLLAHRIVDVADGEICTTIEHRLEGAQLAAFSGAPTVAWDGAKRTRRELPARASWLRTGTDVVMPGELDATGRFHLSGNVHRFSGGGAQLMAQCGWTADYERENDIGFSTFEFQLDVADPPALGTLIDTEACLLRVGASSLHIAFRHRDGRSGATLATLHQLGVHLDKNTRRPSPMAAHIRAAATAALSAA